MDVIHNIVGQLFEWIQSLGYFGIMLGLMLEVIPSEIVLAYGGFLVSQGNINFLGAMIFGTVGGVVAQLFIYWIGRYGGRPVLERYGKYILIQKTHRPFRGVVSQVWNRCHFHGAFCPGCASCHLDTCRHI